ncbi:MAG: endonuclease VIII [Eubacteriales bacterium]|nr:endonuclease VIII [Eubacteriales bacterium]
MLEYPETVTLGKQLNQLAGKRIARVYPPTKPHKFCWFTGDPAAYDAQLKGAAIQAAEGFGSFVDLVFDSGERLCVNDGINVRLLGRDDTPKDYQLLMAFDDGDMLAFTVAMYGGIMLHGDDFDNEYYRKSKAALPPSGDAFASRFHQLLAESKQNLSAKAFLATKQRFPGIGNGVLQDILFTAGIHPKRKIGSFSAEEKERLLAAVVSVLAEMAELGGRDTEKDLYGHPGGYATKLSRNTLASGCPRCGHEIVKEAYMGGAVYYCPHCQPATK